MTSSISSTPPSKSGAPKASPTTLPHGYYSHSFNQWEKECLEHGLLGGLTDEENLLRVLIDRSVSSMDLAKMTTAQVVVSLRAISGAIGRIESIQRSRKALYDEQVDYEKMMAELKYPEEWEDEPHTAASVPAPSLPPSNDGIRPGETSLPLFTESSPAPRAAPLKGSGVGATHIVPVGSASSNDKSVIPTTGQLLKRTEVGARHGLTESIRQISFLYEVEL